MNKFAFCGLFFAGWLMILSPSAVKAQNAGQETDGAPQVERPSRPNLLRELDLSPDQIQRIRRFNKDRRAVTQQSQRRLKAANQALDEAINTNADEAEVQARQKEIQAAHADFVRNRTVNEQFVKQVLTPEQFDRFRGLQADYKQMRKQAGINAKQNVINNRRKDTPNNVQNEGLPNKDARNLNNSSLTPRQQRQQTRRQNQQDRRENLQKRQKP